MKTPIKTELIENYIKENGISKTGFCKSCKISTSTLNNIYANKDFNLISLFKIARKLKTKYLRTFRRMITTFLRE